MEVTTPTLPDTQFIDNQGVERRQANSGETFVALAFQHRELPVVAYYIVETARRAELAGDEAHFFAAVTCQ